MAVSQLKELHQKDWYMNTDDVAPFLMKYDIVVDAKQARRLLFEDKIPTADLRKMFEGLTIATVTPQGQQRVDLFRQMECEVASFIPA